MKRAATLLLFVAIAGPAVAAGLGASFPVAGGWAAIAPVEEITAAPDAAPHAVRKRATRGLRKSAAVAR